MGEERSWTPNPTAGTRVGVVQSPRARRSGPRRSRRSPSASSALASGAGRGRDRRRRRRRCGGDATRTNRGPGAARVPHFVDETAAAGIDHVYDGGFEFFVGGGVAVFDCDDDGRRDLYFAGGTEPASLHRNVSTPGGELRFSPEPSPVTDLTEVTGAYPLDIDGDARVDLVVLRRGPNVVLRGTGDCRFVDATETFGIDPGNDWTTAFSATWEGRESLPTVAFGSYLTLDRSECGDSVLIRPGPDGDHYGEPVALRPGYCTLSVLFSDWDRPADAIFG